MKPIARSLLALILLPASGSAQPTAPEFGTSNVSYTSIPSWEFVKVRIEDATQQGGDGVPSLCFSGNGALADAAPHLPGGALLVSLNLDYCDEHPTLDLNLNLYSFSGQNQNPVHLATFVSNGVVGCQSVSLDLLPQLYTVNNQSRRLLLEFSVTGLNGGSGACDIKAFGTTIGYRLQVSDPPAMPTFNDVPASDPAYQFVEALVASGITAGCGGSNYCPDAPVTRRQMAVFLSKALGLWFP